MAWYSSIANRYARQTEAPVNQKDATVKRAGIAVASSGGGRLGRGSFENPPVDFDQIQAVYNGDGYVRQALDKYIYLMFKEGYKFTSRNQNAIDYIKARLRLMSFGTNVSENELFNEMAATLVRDANVFILKARQDIKVKLQGVNIKPIPGISKPVAGYFVQNTSSVTISRDTNGTPLAYRVTVSGVGNPIDFKPQDVIHIYYDKEPGQAFAVPFVWEVLEDVTLLRQLEETVAKMVHKETFPLRDVSVGSDEEGKWASEEEIVEAKDMVENLPEDGWAIHGGHIKLDVLGGQGEALDARPYLDYFESRVFTGLGVSAVMMGRGEGASRSTADNLTDQMFDRILGLQKVLQDAISNKMFLEILLEGGFDPLNNPDDMVFFEFNPVDSSKLINNELHAMQLFQGNAIPYDEFRRRIKAEPVTDFSMFYSNLFKIPEITAQAEAQARASGAISAQAGNGTGTAKAVDNKTRPANQNGKKAAGARTKNTTEAIYERLPLVQDFNEYFTKQYGYLRSDLSDCMKKYFAEKETKSDAQFSKVAGLLFGAANETIKNQAKKSALNAIIKGSEDTRQKIDPYKMPAVNYDMAMVRVKDSLDRDIDRILGDVMIMAERASQAKDTAEAISKLNAAMDAIQFRISFIARTDLSKAYNYGVALCAKSFGKEKVKVKADCENCRAAYPEAIVLDGDFYNKIPPATHPNCNCELEFE
jgi:hypothetical protein